MEHGISLLLLQAHLPDIAAFLFGHLSQTLKCRTSEIAFACLQGNCNIQLRSITYWNSVFVPSKLCVFYKPIFHHLGIEILKHSKHINSQLLTALMADRESTETPSRYINLHCRLHKPATEN